MKYITKRFLVFAVLFVSSCNLLELEDKLSDPNAVTADNAELDLVMNNVVLEFVEFVDEASDETMPYVRLTAMDGGNRYDNQDGPSSFDFIWGKAYSELMPDINLVISIAEESGATVHAGMAKTIKAYIMMTLVDLFGDVPYSEAFLGVEKPSPKADSGASVYDAALALLNSATDDLKNPVGSVPGDIYYGGNAGKWAKLANTLKLRYHVNTKLVGGTGAGAKSAIDAGVITDIADDFQFQYGTNRENPDARHPYYSDGYENGGPSWYLSNYYMWLMLSGSEKQTEDPRLRYYFYRQDCDENGEDFFTLDCQAGPYPSHWPLDAYPYCTASSDLFGDPNMQYGGYWGRDHGNDDGIPPDDLKKTAWGLYPAGGKFDADDCSQVSNNGVDGGRGAGIQPIMLASWVHFMRAEAALTMNTGEDARAQLEMGVRKSISKVMGFKSVSAVDPAFEPTTAQVDAYVAEVLGQFDAATDKMNVVMKEYFLALQGNGLEAYNGYRRTCKPAAMQPTREPDPGPFARSFWYPASYVNRNANASQKSSVGQPVFWDTNPDGCVN